MSNSISFVGTLTADATVGNTPGGTSVLRCRAANDVGFGDHKKTNFFSVSLFGKRADGRLVDFMRKGAQVFITGEFSAREYQDKNGEKRFSLDVNAHDIQLVGGKRRSQGGVADQGAPPVEYYDDVGY